MKKIITLVLMSLLCSVAFADREELEPVIFDGQVTFSNGVAFPSLCPTNNAILISTNNEGAARWGQLKDIPAVAAFDTYVTNGWITSSGVVTLMPFTNNSSVANCFDNAKKAFTPPCAGWYQVNASINISTTKQITIYLTRFNASSTNNIQSGGWGSRGNTFAASLNSVFYDDGQTNWYSVRCLVNSAQAVVGGTNGPTRFSGHFIGR